MALIEQLDIAGYRLFDQLRVSGLTRVNLVVGRNNAGKTALLEAVEALVSEGSPFAFYRASLERGETRRGVLKQDSEAIAIDVRRWFRNHLLKPGAHIRIASGGSLPRVLECKVLEVSSDQGPPFVPGGFRLDTKREPRDRASELQLPVQPNGLLGAPPVTMFLDFGPTLPRPVSFVTTRRQTVTELLPLWSRVVLTPQETDVAVALRAIDPAIERVALSGLGDEAVGSVLLHGAVEPVPLGSLGEGTTRMLAIALSLATAKGGFLLVDEIDTGLHHTVMADMWRLVIETAKRLDVQVFATTHSLDCVNALGWLVETNVALGAEVSLHRIERGRDRTTPYTAAEIAAAARHHSELR
ncbi:MAG: AAA family ATPase [Deltaproteobacteria bacterium]|nr:AAA family ATPase [Deltaproteobacteria bacterium]